LIFTISNF